MRNARRERLTLEYSSGRWKKQEDGLFSPSVATQTMGVLFDAGFLPPLDQPFTFISPSANIATHEYAMWNQDALARQAPNIFVTADLVRFGNNICTTGLPIDLGPHRFRTIEADGNFLPFLNGSADMIWDRRGCLWYAGQNDLPMFELPHLVNEYSRVLQSKGIIVIDNIAGFKKSDVEPPLPKQMLWNIEALIGIPERFRPKLISGKPIMQYDPSTVDIINNNKPNFWKKISKQFDIYDLGEGMTSVRVLRKRNP